MGFQDNQNAHKQPGLPGPQRQYLRALFLDVIHSIPLPPDRARSSPTSGPQAFPLFAGLSRKDLTAPHTPSPLP